MDTQTAATGTWNVGDKVRLRPDFRAWDLLGVTPTEVERLRDGEPGTITEVATDRLVVEFPWDEYELMRDEVQRPS